MAVSSAKTVRVVSALMTITEINLNIGRDDEGVNLARKLTGGGRRVSASLNSHTA